MSLASSFNPSDYEYLLKSIAEGSALAKAQGLKRLNTLVVNDKKQFGVYAKRVVMALQELMFEQKEEIHLLATMLVLEMINLNPKDIEYYIRTKLLKQVVVNLGDPKPQLRKTSHYTLLAFVKTYKHIDDLITFYLDNGLGSPEPQLRQKCINSFQSIVITETKYLNWASPEFKRLFELLLQKLKDDNPYVQKAAEQCLLTLSRMEELKAFLKKLSPPFYNLYRIFHESQTELVALADGKADASENMSNSHKSLHRHGENQKFISHNNSTNQKAGLTRQDSINKQGIIDRIEEIRRNAMNPKPQEATSQVVTKKPEAPKEKQSVSVLKERQRTLPPFTSREEKKEEPSPQKKVQGVRAGSLVSLGAVSVLVRAQKVQNVFGKKVLQDLKNEKEWKVRLQAIEQLQAKFQLYKESFEVQSLMKMFVPILIKLLADPNFKIAFIALKIIEEILKLPLVKLDVIVPQVLQKLTDNKVALRQNVSKLVRSEYLATNSRIWIDSLLDQMKKNPQPSLREEVLNILTRLYEDKPIEYSYERVIQAVCPLMDDAKTKIKIRTLDLLVLVTVQTQKVDNIKSLLMNKLNQVYYQMFVEKVAKEAKNRQTPAVKPQSDTASEPAQPRPLAFPSLKKHNKTSANNSTSSSLQKYAKTVEAKPLTRASSFLDKQSVEISLEMKESVSRSARVESIQLFSTRNLVKDRQQDLSQGERGNLTPTDSVRRKPLKNFKKKLQRTLQSKLLTNYTSDTDGIRPLNDPQRQLNNVMTDIKSDDWQTASDSLIKLRRIIRHHSQCLNSVAVKAVAIDVMRHVESLRSSLSKNAVITINQLSNATRKALDTQLELIFTKLMRKTLDANSFISEEVRRALVALGCNCSQNRVVTLLLTFQNSRSLPVKQNVLSVIQAIIRTPKVYEREIQRIMQILVAFMGQGALDIRERTKILLLYVLDCEKPNSKIVKLISTDIMEKLKKRDSVLERRDSIASERKVAVLEKNESILVVSPKKEKEEQELSSPRKKRKITNFPPQFQRLDEFLKDCEAAEWKTRVQGLGKVIELLRSYPEEMGQHKLGTRVIEVISRQLNDPNSKVAANALILFKDIVPTVPKLIQANLASVVNELFSCFGSQKGQLRESALGLFDLIADSTEKWMLVQHLCNGALYGPVRSKASILVKLLKILPDTLRSSRPSTTKNVYNMLNKVTEDTKPELVPILKQLVTLCLSLGGDDALSALKQQAKSLAD